MQNLYFLAYICFFLWIIRNVLFWVSLWQDREYRLDRLSAHIKETYKGRKLLFSPLNGVKILLILAFGLVVFNDAFLLPYQVIISILYVIQGILVLKEILNHQVKRPTMTLKAIAIIFLSLLFLSTLFLLPLTDKFLWFLVVDKLTIFVIALFVFFFAFPTEIYTDIQIQKAKKKLANNKHILIIAVSGSYGKSSTKECIAQILEKKYHVVKTFGSNNTPIGITKTILSRITQTTDIFVVEVGAYKRGEIAEICEIITPQISVTTSVSDQHLSLYGSVKNAIETERELLQALPKNGLSLFNGNNENTHELYKKYKRKKVLYVCTDKANEEANIIASNIVVMKDAVSFDVLLEGKVIHMKSPLLGAHMIENILPAIFLANYLKIPPTTITRAVANLVPPPKTMTKKILENGVIAIDDTFNASPESVKAALSYMSIYKRKKIFVLTPLIELGAHAIIHHYEIGRMIGLVCDYLFVTNSNFHDEIMRGVRDSDSNCQVVTIRPIEIAVQISNIAKKGDVVLFEGKEAGFVLNKLL